MEYVRATVSWMAQHEAVVWLLGSASVIALLAVTLALPIVVTRIPADYFVDRGRRPVSWSRQHPLMRGILLTAKTAVGGLLVVAGLAMLFLPGQGVLTILMGLTLMSFPGKFALERRLVRLVPVARSINWMRRLARKRELVMPKIAEDDG